LLLVLLLISTIPLLVPVLFSIHLTRWGFRQHFQGSSHDDHKSQNSEPKNIAGSVAGYGVVMTGMWKVLQLHAQEPTAVTAISYKSITKTVLVMNCRLAHNAQGPQTSTVKHIKMTGMTVRFTTVTVAFHYMCCHLSLTVVAISELVG
jgi:hypothetical protein